MSGQGLRLALSVTGRRSKSGKKLFDTALFFYEKISIMYEKMS